MAFSLSQRVVETMPSGTWNDFTDLPAEFISQFGSSSEAMQYSCYYSDSFIRFATAMDDVLIGACLISTVINFIVIACSAKLYKKKGDTLHLFILNMTIGDTILTLFCHPYELVTRRYSGAHVHFITVFLNFANWVGLAVSGLSLTLLNIDKLIFFCWPFKYDIWMSYFRAKLFCYLSWIISIGFATYYWMYSYMYFVNATVDIQFSPVNKIFYEVFTVVFCVIPIVSSLLVSCYLYDLTKRKRKTVIKTSSASKIENKATSFAFIFATTLWTSCSLLPYRIANLARIHIIAWPNLDCESRQNLSWLTWSMLYLLILNPIINPLITAFAYAPYRQMIYSRVRKSSRKNYQDQNSYETNKSNITSTNSVSSKVFYVDLTMAKQNHTKTLRKAPLAKFPSICSCGSFVTNENLQCTRF
eukprot:NP_741821.1 AEX-2 related neuropeptide Receptor [Caenorhabditis elegans]